MTTPLTVQSAKEILKSPLRFGDPDQIRAVDFLSSIEEAGPVEALRKCRELHRDECSKCDGDGTCYHCNSECDKCDGTGYVDQKCTCMSGFPLDVVENAEDELDNE